MPLLANHRARPNRCSCGVEAKRAFEALMTMKKIESATIKARGETGGTWCFLISHGLRAIRKLARHRSLARSGYWEVEPFFALPQPTRGKATP